MTPQEAADFRALEKRIGKLESKLFYLGRTKHYWQKRAQKESFLHGILLLHKIPIPERLEPR